MTENEAIERLQCMRLFMEINDRQNDSKFLEDDYIANKMVIKALEEIQQYRAIGTIEELKALKEKNTKKRFNIFESHGMRQFVCGCCDRPILTTDNYCSFCGQKIDWQRKEKI